MNIHVAFIGPTYEQPLQESIGIRHVLVNGKRAVSDGIFTGTTAGKVLRRAEARPKEWGTMDVSLKGDDVCTKEWFWCSGFWFRCW